MNRFLTTTLLVSMMCAHTLANETARKDEARSSFEQGVQAFEEGRVSEALIAFQRAYSLRPSFRILYNIGQAQTELGLTRQAVESFEKYLAEGKGNIDTERRITVEQELRRLRAKANMHDAPKRPKPVKKRPKVKLEAKAVPKKEEKKFVTTGLPWMTTGFAAVTLTAAAICAGRTAKLNKTLNSACAEGACPPDRRKDIDKMKGLAVAADVLFATTAVLTTTAITLFVVGKKKKKRAAK